MADKAVGEARIYAAAGFQGLMIENMHDRPYLKGTVGPEIVAAMAVAGREVRRAVPLPLGVQVLAGANRAGLARAPPRRGDLLPGGGLAFAHPPPRGPLGPRAGGAPRLPPG